jgi:hypothetical protein
MLFPIIPLPTPILEGTRHLVIDYKPILAVNILLQSPVLKIANRESRILVTNKVEVIYKAGAEYKVKVKYKAKIAYKAKQVRGYPDFLKSPKLTITNRNISKPFLISVSFSIYI